MPLVIVIGLLFIVAGSILRQNLERKSISDLSNTDFANELSGAQPIRSDLAWKDRKVMQALRSTLANHLDFQKSQRDKMTALEPGLRLLDTPESFSSTDNMQRSIGVLDQCLAIDNENLTELQRGPDSLRASLQPYQLSQAEEQFVVKSFSDGLFDSGLVDALRQTLAAESAWVDATRELYQFSLQHASQIAVQNSRVVIGSSTVRMEFDRKRARSNSLYTIYFAAYQSQQKLLAEQKANVGGSPAGSGAKE